MNRTLLALGMPPLLSLLLACGGDHSKEAAPEGVFDFGDFDDKVDVLIEQQGLEGVTTVVVHRDSGVVHLRGHGAFETDRLYALASLSKPLSAGVIMHLHDEGVVDIDAPIGDYVGEAWGAGKPELTLAQMLSNSAGLVGLEGETSYAPYVCQFVPAGTLEDCAQTIYSADDAADRIDPDTQFKYGGGQWQLAGGVAAVASGRDWAQLVDETYGPCGVPSLGYFHPLVLDANIGEYPAALGGDAANLMASDNYLIGGGAHVTAEDLAKVLLMHLRGGECDGQRALSEASVARMQVDRIGEVYGGTTGSARVGGYGLGWWVYRDRDEVVYHGGTWGAIAWLDNVRGYAAFIAMEADGDAGRAFLTATQPILDRVFDP